MNKRDSLAVQPLSRRSVLKFTGASALAVGGASFLQACGAGAGSSTASLSYIAGDTADPERAVYTSWIKGFERSADLDVTGQHLSYGTDFLTKLEAQIGAGRPPDLITRWFSDEARAYEDQLAPVNDLMEELSSSAQWDESALSRFKVGDDYIGVPLDITLFPFFWRQDLLNDANLAVPTNWDELLTAAEALTSDGVYGTILPYGRSTQASYYFWIMLWTNGGYVIDANGDVAVGSGEVTETLEFLKELAQFSPPGSGQYEWAENLGEFVNGTGASVLYQGRVLGSIQADNPKIADSLAVGAVPYGREPATLGLWSGSSVTSASDEIEGAKELIRYMHEPKPYAEWLNLAPGHSWAADRSMESNPDIANNELRKKYADIISTIQEMSSVARSFSQESAEHELNPKATAILNSNVLADMLQMVLINGDSASKAASWGAEQVETIVAT